MIEENEAYVDCLVDTKGIVTQENYHTNTVRTKKAKKSNDIAFTQWKHAFLKQKYSKNASSTTVIPMKST